MLKKALMIYRKLMEKGELDARADSELYMDFKNEEVRQILGEFEEELDFRLLDTGNRIYLIPNMDNDIMGYTMKELRTRISADARMADAYLQNYICILIFYLFYGGKNTNPIQREFIQTKDLIGELDNRMSRYLENEEAAQAEEEAYGVNFYRIAQLWNSKQIGDSVTRKSKIGTLRRAYSQLEEERLIRILEEGKQIRRTKRMDDLFLYYYLDEERVQELHKIFGGE